MRQLLRSSHVELRLAGLTGRLPLLCGGEDSVVRAPAERSPVQGIFQCSVWLRRPHPGPQGRSHTNDRRGTGAGEAGAYRRKEHQNAGLEDHGPARCSRGQEPLKCTNPATFLPSATSIPNPVSYKDRIRGTAAADFPYLLIVDRASGPFSTFSPRSSPTRAHTT